MAVKLPTPFITTIREGRNNVHLRLVAADWLDNNGGGLRAEFIRLQCKMAAYGTYTPTQWREWSKRKWELVEMDETGLRDNLPGNWHFTVNPYGKAAIYTRGFVDMLFCPAVDWLACADTILEQHPIETVNLLTEPSIAWYDSSNGFVNRREWKMTDYRWPGITFQLPWRQR